MKPNQLSQTAAFIAIKFYGLTLKPPFRSLFDKPIITFYDQLVSTLPAPLGTYHSALKKDWLRSFFMKAEEWLLPGDLMHILMRKYYIQKMVRRLAKEGYSQLIVLGAGFDHLSALWSQKGLHSYEMDSPRMAGLKQAFVKQYGYENDRLHIYPINFGEQALHSYLTSIPGLSPDKKTVVLAEGFFDYLPKTEVRKLLTAIHSFYSKDLALISTIFALDELNIFHRSVFRAGVQMVGEKLQLHYSAGEFRELLEDLGYTLAISHSNTEMRQQQLKPRNISMPVLNGFYVIMATNNK